MKDSDAIFEYYDERASEYDEIYQGGIPGIPESEMYRQDVEMIKTISADFGEGHLIDIGCGTAYWLPYYAKNCSEITLVDQSRRMLARSQKRVSDLSLDIDIHYIKGNFLDLRFLSRTFDSAVAAFLISHLEEEEAQVFFDKLRKILKSRSHVLWIDGSWSEVRSKYRSKAGLQERKIKNGQTFTIFKRYFDEHDIDLFLEQHALTKNNIYFGDVFFAVDTRLRY